MKGAAASAETTATLVSRYFDTANCSLRSAGLSLRVREIGERRLQTLKADKAVVGGVSNPIEIEAEINTDEPVVDAIDDKKLRRKVKRLLAKSPLVLLFSTEIRRTTTQFITAAGDTVEVALDSGLVRAGSKTMRLREAEIELKAGNPKALLAFVEEITGDGPIRPSLFSKADRGYLLLGEPAAVPEVARSKSPRVEPGTTSDAAIGEICRTVSWQILNNWQMLGEHDDADAAHQLRVGLRRLRAVLRIMRTIVDDDTLRDLDCGAREVGRIVGSLRDLDVLLAEIITPLAMMDHVKNGIATVRRRVVAEKKARRKEVLAELRSTKFGLMRVELGLLPHLVSHLAKDHAKPFERPVEDLARRALQKLLRRVSEHGRNLSELTIEQRHELRKAIKPLRYSMEFFAPLYSQTKVKELLACAGELQTTLGYLNDVALADKLQKLDWSGNARAKEASQAVGAVIGWHAARFEQAWSEVKGTWKRFERAAKLLA